MKKVLLLTQYFTMAVSLVKLHPMLCCTWEVTHSQGRLSTTQSVHTSLWSTFWNRWCSNCPHPLCAFAEWMSEVLWTGGQTRAAKLYNKSGNRLMTTPGWLMNLWLCKLRQPPLLLFWSTIFADHCIYEHIVNVTQNGYWGLTLVSSLMTIITEVNKDSVPSCSTLVLIPIGYNEHWGRRKGSEGSSELHTPCSKA